MHRAVAARDHGGAGPRRATLSALCATFVGIGLARFAYTPLIPVLIAADWFSPGQAAYLGAANLAGYLAGALFAGPMAARASAPVVLRVMMVLATATFFACATPLSFAWFFVWRVLSGLSGGVLMVLAAPTVLPHVPPSRQGLAGGLVFTGVGLGIAASGTLVPLLLHAGLVETWLGLGALALVLTVVAWAGWPNAPVVPVNTDPVPPAARRHPSNLTLKSLYVEYGLNAVGLVPHMVFLVDFIVRGLGQGLVAGAWYWVLFGLGAMLGPVLAGQIADRIGFRPALRLAIVIQVACVGWLAIADHAVALVISSTVVGAFVPGIVALVLGRIHELTPRDRPRQQAGWSFATIAFALGQAGAAYGFSFLFASGGGYAQLFLLAATALLLALLIDLVVAGHVQRGSKTHNDKS